MTSEPVIKMTAHDMIVSMHITIPLATNSIMYKQVTMINCHNEDAFVCDTMISVPIIKIHAFDIIVSGYSTISFAPTIYVYSLK